MTLPSTLQQAVLFFSNLDQAQAYFAEVRWPEGVACPTCGSKAVGYIKTRRLWQCKKRHPKRQFSVKVGTVLEDSPMPLSGWMLLLWLLTTCKNGVSSYEAARAIGTTQKTAWFMLQRLRRGFMQEKPVKLKGDLEVDETFIGGKARNMHKSRRKKVITGTGGVNKTIVVGVLQRGGTVQTTVVEERTKPILHQVVHDRAKKGARVITDELLAYWGLNKHYAHEVINHAFEYVRGAVHTNGMENFWSLLKRTLGGTYIAVQPFHLFRYIDEQVFRYNTRKDMDDQGRFRIALGMSVGKRLTWAMLTLQAKTD